MLCLGLSCHIKVLDCLMSCSTNLQYVYWDVNTWVFLLFAFSVVLHTFSAEIF